MTIKTSIAILLLVAGLFILTPGASNNACAQPAAGGGEAGEIAEQTCDSQVWRSMEARARLETEREISQNQNLIFKADSILDYTCFDNMAAHVSKNVGILFTHTTYFEGEVIPWGAPYGMDNAIQTSVVNAMRTYTDSNFGHALLGGRGEELDLPDPPVNDVGAQGRDYTCEIMNQVWSVAKCLNFQHTEMFATHDGFYPFITIQAIDGEPVEGYQDRQDDVRHWPTPCAVDGHFAEGSWEAIYRLSRNETAFGVGDPLYQYQTPLNEAYVQVRELLEPNACALPIPTGINVIRGPNSQETSPDGVCTNPGCSYVGTTCQPPGGAGVNNPPGLGGNANVPPGA